MAWNYNPFGRQLASEFSVGDLVRVKTTSTIGRIDYINMDLRLPYQVRFKWHETFFSKFFGADHLELMVFNEPDVMQDYVEAIK